MTHTPTPATPEDCPPVGSAKHTFGKWSYVADTRDYGDGEEIVGWNVYANDGEREIIGCEGILNDDDAEDIVRLIAAAPELLAALKAIVLADDRQELCQEHIESARCLIARATGAQ